MSNTRRGCFAAIAVAAVLIITAVAGFAYFYSQRAPQLVTVVQQKPTPPKPGQTVGAVEAAELHFASADAYNTLEREDAAVKAAVPEYTLKPNLSNVANLKLFKETLNPAQIAMIAKNKFVVSPTDYIQMFQVYENNEYQTPEKFPAFITTDSMLHTYHIFYDYSLRRVEVNKLFDACVRLTDTMLAASEKDMADARDATVKDAAARNTAYFAVARFLLTGKPAPSSVADMAKADLARISAHQGRDMSAVFGYKIDFSQFVPRGHYTRNEKLKKYFKAMMWYGLAPFALPQGKIGDRATRQALLVVRDLRTISMESESAMKLWDMIYEPTVFYVGKADDYTVYQYSKLIDKVYGENPTLDAFADDAKLVQFIAEVNKLPGPRIEQFVADPLLPTGRQFRFMGQRFIPDSRILQELTHEKVNGRNFPKGLDVMAALGSGRALDILEKTYKVNDFQGYQTQMVKMRNEIKGTPRETWQSNLYYGWMWSLQSLIKPAPAGYPSFMQSNTWLDKSLFTALGSWTELRHDTILYAKQSVSECGGGGEEVPTPKGYVEPNLEFWSKLKWLNEYTREGLNSRRLLDEELKDKFDKLGDWIDFCRNITIKELTGKKVTEEEYAQMQIYGAELEALLLSFAGGDILSDTDKDMALVADVHTSSDSVLEEGTGRAAEIFVVVPIEGKLYLTRGAVYTQYEFAHPASDRLTDEAWQKMLKSGQEPGLAEWVNTFFLQKKKKPVPEFENYFGGC